MTRSVFARVTALAAVIALLPTGHLSWVSAQSAQSSFGPIRADAGTVTGTVWNRNDTPVVLPRLRLRDVTTGHIVRVTQGDDLGRFTFL